METFNISASGGFAHALFQRRATLIISTYQAGRVFLISSTDGEQLTVQPTRFKKPMGIAMHSNRMAVATMDRIEIYAHNESVGKNSPLSFQQYDHFYVPRMSYVSGHLDLHDIHMHRNGVFAVNTQFNCISSFSIEHHFTPRWYPHFITELAPEDRCHLNGMAVKDDMPAYVTALGSGNEAGSWREGIITDGILMDVKENAILLNGLAMPHSPRFIDDELWLIESAKGTLIRYNTANGKAEEVGHTGAFSRGLAQIDDLLAVGRSKAREGSKTFKKLPPELRNKPAGIDLLDKASGEVVERLHFGSIVDEIYDVQVFCGGKIGLYGMEGMDFFEPITTPETAFWRKTPGNGIAPK